MRISSERGIVIRAFPYGESDLILRILGEHSGKVSAIAKGARKSRKRFSGSFDLFDFGMFELKEGKSELYFLQKYTAHKGFNSVRSNWDKLTTASIVCEAFDMLIKEDMGDEVTVFDGLYQGLGAIDKAGSSKEVLKYCHTTLRDLLSYSGFLSAQAIAPSAKNLLRLIKQIESFSEREMQSRKALLMLLSSLRKGQVAESSPEALTKTE